MSQLVFRGTQLTPTSFSDPLDFSLVQGGPLFQLLLRAKLAKPSMDMLARRIIVIAGVAWVPLLVLTLLSGTAFGGVGLHFLRDPGVHTRLLLCVPALVAAEVIVHRRIRVTVRQFVDRGIVAPEDRPRFEDLIASAMRLRNSVLAEVLVLALAIILGHSVAPRYVAMDIASWLATPVNGATRFTPAGYWYVFVSLTIFRFLLLRWYFRLFVWWRFLWQVSRRIPLHLNPLHPDRTAGLGFLAGSAFALQPVLVAHTLAFAGVILGKIWNEGATLPQFKMEIVFWLVFLIMLVVTPLFFFVNHLSNAKRAGSIEYGVVGSRYVAEFRRKWIDGRAAKDEALIGTADIQSLADLANSFEVVTDMRVVPFGRAALVRMAVVTLLPLAPLLLTMFPLEKLIDRAVGVFV
jgi:hypothetical protein